MGLEARCQFLTWKRMKMGHILESGPSETRSWHFGAASPFWKLILVRPRTDDGRPSLREVSTPANLAFPIAPLAGSPREEQEACKSCIRAVVA
jgi:hypothetical protein